MHLMYSCTPQVMLTVLDTKSTAEEAQNSAAATAASVVWGSHSGQAQTGIWENRSWSPSGHKFGKRLLQWSLINAQIDRKVQQRPLYASSCLFLAAACSPEQLVVCRYQVFTPTTSQQVVCPSAQNTALRIWAFAFLMDTDSRMLWSWPLATSPTSCSLKSWTPLSRLEGILWVSTQLLSPFRHLSNVDSALRLSLKQRRMLKSRPISTLQWVSPPKASSLLDPRHEVGVFTVAILRIFWACGFTSEKFSSDMLSTQFLVGLVFKERKICWKGPRPAWDKQGSNSHWYRLHTNLTFVLQDLNASLGPALSVTSAGPPRLSAKSSYPSKHPQWSKALFHENARIVSGNQWLASWKLYDGSRTT